MIPGAVIVATNDVPGIYRANVGGGFSTHGIVIISRPVQLVLRKMTKRCKFWTRRKVVRRKRSK